MTEPRPPSGYLSETTYPDRYYRELSPTWLDYVAAVCGAALPRSLDGDFTYLDLGCGFAHSTVVHAGAFPRASFHGCDLNAEHIATARSHAKRLGIENVLFHETDIEALLERGLPDFDFIVLHGVYSWVGPDVRRTIQRLVAEKLKPGGLLYVSYNCLPGWSAEAPLRKLMLELAGAERGDPEARARSAASAVERLSQGGFKYFGESPAAVAAVQSFSDAPANYLAHEFLNPTWQLYYSVDVADDMAEAGASYVGSATLAENHPVLVIDKHAAEAIAKLTTPRLQKLALDFAVNRRFRRDVFVGRGARALAPEEALRNLDGVAIGCIQELDAIRAEAHIPRGKITFQDEFVRDLRALLADGPVRLGDLVAELGGSNRSGPKNALSIKQNLIFLVAAGVLMPFATTAPPPSAPAPRRFATPVVEKAVEGLLEARAPAFVPSVRLGSGVLVAVEEARALLDWLAGKLPHAPERLRHVGLVG